MAKNHGNTVNTRIGEIGLHEPGAADILLRPSFLAFSQIDDLQDVIRGCISALSAIESNAQPTPYDLCSCAAVLHACGLPDTRADLTGSIEPAKPAKVWRLPTGARVVSDGLIGRGMRWRVGKILPHNLVVIANSLISSGVIGDKKRARKAKAKGHGKFDPAEFVAVAVAHLGLPPDAAWQLTMAEFQLLMDAKYPPKTASMTPDEVRSAMQRCGIKLQ